MLLSQRSEMPQLPQLGFRVSANDATRSGAFRRRISIRRRKAPQALLSQRRYKSQLPQCDYGHVCIADGKAGFFLSLSISPMYVEPNMRVPPMI